MERLGDRTDNPQPKTKIFDIRVKIAQKREDLNNSIMTICSDANGLGDINQADKIKKGAIELYLMKLSNFVTQIEKQESEKNKTPF